MSFAKIGIDVTVSFILAGIAFLIGTSLIAPVSKAVDSILAQITLILVFFVFLGVIFFMTLLGKLAMKEISSDPIQEILDTEIHRTENCKNCGGPNVDRVTCAWCGQVLD